MQTSPLSTNQTPKSNVSNQKHDKVIGIETCRDCAHHKSSTWHDETKYKKNFIAVKTAIEMAVPGCEVVPIQGGLINLGAFEIMHGDKLLYSKKSSGLWPNPQAVAMRIKGYFDDLESGKDVTSYGTGSEKAFQKPKKKIDPFSRTANYGRFTDTQRVSTAGTLDTRESQRQQQKEANNAKNRKTSSDILIKEANQEEENKADYRDEPESTWNKREEPKEEPSHNREENREEQREEPRTEDQKQEEKLEVQNEEPRKEEDKKAENEIEADGRQEKKEDVEKEEAENAQ